MDINGDIDVDVVIGCRLSAVDIHTIKRRKFPTFWLKGSRKGDFRNHGFYRILVFMWSLQSSGPKDHTGHGSCG